MSGLINKIKDAVDPEGKPHSQEDSTYDNDNKNNRNTRTGAGAGNNENYYGDNPTATDSTGRRTGAGSAGAGAAGYGSSSGAGAGGVDEYGSTGVGGGAYNDPSQQQQRRTAGAGGAGAGGAGVVGGGRTTRSGATTAGTASGRSGAGGAGAAGTGVPVADLGDDPTLGSSAATGRRRNLGSDTATFGGQAGPGAGALGGRDNFAGAQAQQQDPTYTQMGQRVVDPTFASSTANPRVAGAGTGAGAGAGVGAGAGGYGAGNTGAARNTAGPHDSDIMNKLDPRVDSDRDGSRQTGSGTGGRGGAGNAYPRGAAGGNSNYP